MVGLSSVHSFYEDDLLLCLNFQLFFPFINAIDELCNMNY